MSVPYILHIIKFGKDLMKFWQKRVGSFFWHTLYCIAFSPIHCFTM